MKNYTDLKQSKKLAEFLPIESADGWWTSLNWQETEYYVEVKQDGINKPKKCIPCWSLTALLEVIPKYIKKRAIFRMDISEIDSSIWYDDLDSCAVDETLPDITTNNLVDACFEMILKLHELKLL